MKKIFLNSIAIALTVITVGGCDFVQNANPSVEPAAGTTGGSNIIYRKVLVEDYTGHKCGNCPAAADELSTLEGQYSGKIVPLAIHAGFFANINAAYPTDFRNTVSTNYDTQFGVSAAGNPNGLINRIGYGSGGFIKAYTSWGSEISQMVTQAAKFQIKITNTFNTGSNSLSTDIMVRSLAVNSGTYKLVVLLTEDSIIAEQLDYRIVVPPAPSQKVSDYEFNHLLRGAINSDWGDAVFATGANLNDSIVKSYTNYTINASYNASKCHVIAYIYDADAASPTYYEVLQAEEEKVK
ncbi:MAG: Omp28 family outer membrane lipoprotein [Bacteroidota bacterium]